MEREAAEPILGLAAVIVDCADAGPPARFWELAAGATAVKREADSAWISVGGVLVIFREVPGYQPSSWPGDDVPMQVHLDFAVEDVASAERRLIELGATTPEFQAHRSDGLVVMRDPAGHLFYIGPPA